AIRCPYVLTYSVLNFHRPCSDTSFDSKASAITEPTLVLAYIAGLIPPASIGRGIQAASPTIMYPLATMQSFCLRTGTCQFPFVFPSSSYPPDNFQFLITGFKLTYSSIKDWRVSFLPSLLFLASKARLWT